MKVLYFLHGTSALCAGAKTRAEMQPAASLKIRSLEGATFIGALSVVATVQPAKWSLIRMDFV